MEHLKDVDAKPRGLQVTLVGSPEAWERVFAGCALVMRRYALVKSQLTVRQHERYANWTPDAVLRHLTRTRPSLRPRPRGTGERPSRRAGHSSPSARSPVRPSDDEPSEPPLTRLQVWRLAISDAARARAARLEREYRECAGCLLDVPRDEFRPGRRVCRSCEVAARIERRQQVAA
jgi:hypothetical protein